MSKTAIISLSFTYPFGHRNMQRVWSSWLRHEWSIKQNKLSWWKLSCSTASLSLYWRQRELTCTRLSFKRLWRRTGERAINQTVNALAVRSFYFPQKNQYSVW